MPALILEELVKSYPLPTGERHVVLDVERFTLEAGEQVALDGPSGSGKTTLLHCCAGILRPDRGRVCLAGTELGVQYKTGSGETRTEPESVLDAARGRHLGYVFQTFNLLQSLSALENVELALSFGPDPELGRSAELLRRLGLGDKTGHLPSQLSVGQQQRVALARALAKRPSLVLADEPTGNLDEASAKEALGLLRELCAESKAALLLVSHDPGVLRQFKRRRSLADFNRAGSQKERAGQASRRRKGVRP